MSVIDLTSEPNLAQGPNLHAEHLNSSDGDHARLLRAPNAHLETKLILVLELVYDASLWLCFV